MKKRKENKSLLSLKIELAITILLFIMMMSVIILAFVLMVRGGFVITAPDASQNEQIVMPFYVHNLL